MEHRLPSQMTERIISLIHSWQEGKRLMCHFDTVSLKSSWNSSYLKWAIVTYSLFREFLLLGLITFLFPVQCLNLHKILMTTFGTFCIWRFSTVAETESIVHSPVSIWKVPGCVFDVLKRASAACCHTLTHSDPSLCTGCYRVISYSQRCSTTYCACLMAVILLDSVTSSYLWNILHCAYDNDCHFYHSSW